MPTSESPGRAGPDRGDAELAALRARHPQWLIKPTTLSGYAYALVRGTATRFARDAGDAQAIIRREM